MRFLMFEDFPQITDKDIEKWKTADDKQRGKMVSNILKSYNQEELNNIRPSIRKSFYRYGIDPDKNPFIPFFDALAETNNITKDYDNLVSVMIDLVEKGEIKVDPNYQYEYQLNPSLWNRTKEDFIYTLRAFDIVLDKNKIKKYFKDTEFIDVSEFFLKDGSIKPAGSEATSFDEGTIFGTIESWSLGGGNDKDPEDSKSKEKIDDVEKRKIMKKHRYGSLDEIKNPNKGMRVFVNAASHISDGPNNSDEWMTRGQGFYEWDGKKWVKIGEPLR